MRHSIRRDSGAKGPNHTLLKDLITIMGWLRELLFAGLFVCVVPSTLVLAQASATVQPGPVAPSDSAIQSGSAISKKSSPNKSLRSNTSSGIRSMMPFGASPKASTQLSFQPGIGWQHPPPGAIDSARSVIANSGTRGVASTLSSGTSKRISDEYPSLPSSGATIDEFKLGKATKASNVFADGSANMNLGVWKGTQANSGSISNRTGNASLGAAHEFTSHAYISTIKLRGQIRNEPDFETRIKLRKLNDKLTSKHVKHLDSSQEKRSKKTFANSLDSKSMSPSELRTIGRRSGAHDANHAKGRSHKSL
jgi:hypothetical protein